MNVFLNEEIAESYDQYYLSEFGQKVDRIEKNLLQKHLIKIPRKPMLELGCGTGYWTEFFVEQGFKLTASDISEAMLSVARKKHLQAEFVKFDSQNIPFDTESFSVIASITMLEFVHDSEQVLLEIYRVLKPQGWLILACLNSLSEIGKNKEHDETFRKAKLYKPQEFKEKLEVFGKAEIDFGVYLSQELELLDGKPEQFTVEPAFMLGIVQKTK